MTRREREFNKKLEAILEGVGRLNNAEVHRVMVLLAKARSDIAAAVASSEWQAQHLRRLKEAVSRAWDGMAQQHRAGMNTHLANLFNAGIDIVDAPLAAAGIRVTAPEISRTMLEVLQGYSADLISGMGADFVKKVNSALTLGVMGQQTPFEVMGIIGRNMKDKSIVTGISHRAETMIRTESARIHSLARQARMKAAAAGGTDPVIKLMKKWIESGKHYARANHKIGGEVAELDKKFSNGIDYPHAPGLSAEESINCGCSHVLASPDWGSLPKKFEPVAYEPRATYNNSI